MRNSYWWRFLLSNHVVESCNLTSVHNTCQMLQVDYPGFIEPHEVIHIARCCRSWDWEWTIWSLGSGQVQSCKPNKYAYSSELRERINLYSSLNICWEKKISWRKLGLMGFCCSSIFLKPQRYFGNIYKTSLLYTGH